MSDVPPVIIKELLVRLPVKSLLRFRSVSKTWCSLIDSKQFTNLHLQNSYKTNSNSTLLVVHPDTFFYGDLDELKCLKFESTNFTPRNVACCCNGLVLLVFGFKNLVLWNPVTRKSNTLPAKPLDEDQYVIMDQLIDYTCGLGYDSKNDDYKVVRVLQVSPNLEPLDGDGFVPFDTQVYSLKSNTWKTIDNFPYVLPYDKKWDAYLNEALHTVVKVNGKIMAFNFANEEHYEVPKPPVMSNCGLDTVEVMGGCLAAIVHGGENMSEIWVMTEYMVKESWTKLLYFNPPLGDPSPYMCPLAYSKCGNKVLLNCGGKRLIWFDLRAKTISYACVCGLNALPQGELFHAAFLVGSLVSPFSPAVMGAEQQGMKGKDIDKKKRDDFLSAGFKLNL